MDDNIVGNWWGRGAWLVLGGFSWGSLEGRAWSFSQLWVFLTMLFRKVSFLLVGSVMDGLGSPSDSFFRSNHMAIRHDVMALFLATVKSQHKI